MWRSSSKVTDESSLQEYKPAQATMKKGKMKVPAADLDLPKRKPVRRRSSLQRSNFLKESRFLRDLRDIDPEDIEARELLFKQKLQLCETCFYFDCIEEPSKEYQRAMDVKRTTLLELVEYVSNPKNKPALSKRVLPEVFQMVSKNLFRSLPPIPDDYDPDEDEAIMDPSWPHLQVVYEFLLRVVASSEIKSKTAKSHVNRNFVTQLVALFNSDDPRERDYLKTIVHRIYAKFMPCRADIRRLFGEQFREFVYETNRHHGIGEMLMILGSIITGFSKPIKPEHLRFLNEAILPLHQPDWLAHYHPQLSYCMMQYVQKDPVTGRDIIKRLVKKWPWRNSPKQLLLINELEEMLEHLTEEDIKAIEKPLFTMLSKCVASDHFQIAQRTLYVWNNENLKETVFNPRKSFAKIVIKRVVGALSKDCGGDAGRVPHWNETVAALAADVMEKYETKSPSAYNDAVDKFERQGKEDAAAMAERKALYDELDRLAPRFQEKRF